MTDGSAPATSAPKFPTKTAFVMSFSRETPAGEIVAKASGAGFKLTNDQVHNIRSAVKSAKKAKRAKRTTKGAAPAAPAKKAAAPAKKAAASKKTAKKKKSAPKKAAAAPKKKAAAPKAAAATSVGSKKAFIEAQPATMSTAEVIALGKKNGLKISENHVYKVRRKATKGATGAAAKRGPGRPKGGAAKKAATAPVAVKAPVAAAAPAAAGSSTIDTVLADLVVHHGIDRIRQVLAQVETRVTRLLSGK